jgi:integrase
MANELASLNHGKPPESQLLDLPKKNWASEQIRQDFEAAGIKKLTAEGKATFHSLRVNFICAIVESGCDLKTIMELARHSAASLSMEVYAKPNRERTRQAAEAAAQQIQQAISASECCICAAQQVAGA